MRKQELFKINFALEVAMPARLSKILTVLLCWAGCFVTVPSWAETFSFAQYGDIHLADSGTTSTALLDRLVAFINQDLGTPVDFVVDTGDIYQGGNPGKVFASYRQALARLKIPAYVLRGNHDLPPEAPESAWKSGLRRDYHFSFVHKGVAFIGFDTAVNKPSWENPAASTQTLAWLSAQNARLPAQMPVVLLTHVPLGSRMKLPRVYPLVNRGKVLDLFRKRKVLAVISGHYHGARESVENGTLFTTTPTFSPNRGNHDGTQGGAIRIFTIRDGTIRTRLIPFPAPTPRTAPN